MKSALNITGAQKKKSCKIAKKKPHTCIHTYIFFIYQVILSVNIALLEIKRSLQLNYYKQNEVLKNMYINKNLFWKIGPV